MVPRTIANLHISCVAWALAHANCRVFVDPVSWPTLPWVRDGVPKLLVGDRFSSKFCFAK